ncbi:MAG: hypothetical protein AVDCRST_MAG91-3376 [uncultured Sphingomonadaceae bacterium]|uniref:Uncharacterized protein n=1 Tax=uncultured Sphingomonadaceae bacterium TaxID=169976 RepID=A0A6J4TYY7_9SPHN|nr:MAG: hypothetical protein AVDCRST_MAG91-3376 [uncultured Sphingomonadaceae bacterium]
MLIISSICTGSSKSFGADEPFGPSLSKPFSSSSYDIRRALRQAQDERLFLSSLPDHLVMRLNV